MSAAHKRTHSASEEAYSLDSNAGFLRATAYPFAPSPVDDDISSYLASAPTSPRDGVASYLASAPTSPSYGDSPMSASSYPAASLTLGRADSAYLGTLGRDEMTIVLSYLDAKSLLRMARTNRRIRKHIIANARYIIAYGGAVAQGAADPSSKAAEFIERDLHHDTERQPDEHTHVSTAYINLLYLRFMVYRLPTWCGKCSDTFSNSFELFWSLNDASGSIFPDNKVVSIFENASNTRTLEAMRLERTPDYPSFMIRLSTISPSIASYIRHSRGDLRSVGAKTHMSHIQAIVSSLINWRIYITHDPPFLVNCDIDLVKRLSLKPSERKFDELDVYEWFAYYRAQDGRPTVTIEHIARLAQYVLAQIYERGVDISTDEIVGAARGLAVQAIETIEDAHVGPLLSNFNTMVRHFTVRMRFPRNWHELTATRTFARTFIASIQDHCARRNCGRKNVANKQAVDNTGGETYTGPFAITTSYNDAWMFVGWDAARCVLDKKTVGSMHYYYGKYMDNVAWAIRGSGFAPSAFSTYRNIVDPLRVSRTCAPSSIYDSGVWPKLFDICHDAIRFDMWLYEHSCGYWPEYPNVFLKAKRLGKIGNYIVAAGYVYVGISIRAHLKSENRVIIKDAYTDALARAVKIIEMDPAKFTCDEAKLHLQCILALAYANGPIDLAVEEPDNGITIELTPALSVLIDKLWQLPTRPPFMPTICTRADGTRALATVPVAVTGVAL